MSCDQREPVMHWLRSSRRHTACGLRVRWLAGGDTATSFIDHVTCATCLAKLRKDEEVEAPGPRARRGLEKSSKE